MLWSVWWMDEGTLSAVAGYVTFEAVVIRWDIIEVSATFITPLSAPR